MPARMRRHGPRQHTPVQVQRLQGGTDPMLTVKWTKKLSSQPLCVPPESCHDDYMANAAAISDDGSRVVGGTYYQHYTNTTRTKVNGRFGIYCFDTAAGGTPLFTDEYDGDKGIYAVAMSGDGAVAAG